MKKLPIKIAMNCMINKENIGVIFDNFSQSYPEMDVEESFYCKITDGFRFVWIGKIKEEDRDAFMRLTHHAEGIYEDTGAEYVHVDVYTEKWNRYYEIEFDNDIRSRESTDETVGDYSICIIGERKPNYQEAEEFCKKDMEEMGYKHVVAIREIDDDEAQNFFDMEKESLFPVFK